MEDATWFDASFGHGSGKSSSATAMEAKLSLAPQRAGLRRKVLESEITLFRKCLKTQVKLCGWLFGMAAATGSSVRREQQR